MSRKINHFLWCEKFRPDTLDTFICSEEHKNKFQEYINTQQIPHLGFFGKPGSGKSTISKLLANNINCDYIYLNAAENRSMDDIKDKVGSFASSASFKPLKIVILDEATQILSASQVLLLNMIETYSSNVRFILTGNYAERLIEPLRSRCTEFDLAAPSKKTIAVFMDYILTQENVKYEKEDLATIIKKYYPDLRKTINAIQKYSISGKLTLNLKELNNSDTHLDKILNELMKPTLDSFKNIRQTIVDANISSYEDVYRFLYETVEQYAPNREGVIIIKLEEYMYHSSFVLDKEINILAALSSILEIIKQKQVIK
jgi:DNA polymerase III delta prime subunit